MDILITVVIVLMVVVSLWWVLKPLWGEIEEEVEAISPEQQNLIDLEQRKDALYAAIKDLKQDLDAGKITAADYQRMRGEMTQEAAAVLQEIDALSQGMDAQLDAQIDNLLTGYQANGAAKDAAFVGSVRAAIEREADAPQKALCPNCSHSVNPNDTFCSQCGTILTNLCPDCQSVISPDDVFCTYCGARLQVEEAA